MDTLDSLRIFQRVAELGSFARASESLGLSRAAVSLAVQRLEASLGTQLLLRTTRKVQLTQDGQAFYERLRDLLDDMDELKAMFQREGSTLKGRLRVDMASGLARGFVIPRLPEFIAQHPGLTVEISGTDRRVDVVREGFDCVIRIGPLEESSLVARPLGKMRVINCASPGYLRLRGTPQNIDNLADHQIVHFVSTLGQRSPGFEYPCDDGYAHLPMAGAVTVNNGDAYLAAGLAGLGIIQVPVMAVESLLEAGNLVEVLPDMLPEPMPVTILYAHRRNLPLRVRAFMDWVMMLLTPHLQG